MATATSGDEQVSPKATRREWLGLAVLALPCVLYAMDLTVLFLAVPALQRDLHPSGTELLWITDVYGFLLAGLLVTMGRVGDRIGRRRLLLWGGSAFAVASVLAAFSTSAATLIAARALLGVAGATLAPSTLALISTMFADPRERQTAIGVWVTSFSVGAAIGPLLGGALLSAFWWGSVFLLAVPVAVVLLLLGPRLLPEHRTTERARFDLPGALGSIVAVLGVVYALKRAAYGHPDGPALAAVALGLAAGWWFVRRQAADPDPLVPLDLFRPHLSVALGANAFGIFVVGGSDLLVAFHLQLSLGFSPLLAGACGLAPAAAFVLGSLVVPRLADRTAPVHLVAGGLGLAAAGLAFFVGVPADGGVALIVVGTTVTALGVASVVTLATDLVVGAAPPEREGAAAALSETATELGGALGIAVLGSIAAAVYRAGGPGDTLADAVAPGVSPALRDAGLAAAADGLHLAAAVTAVAALLLAALVLRQDAAGERAR